jgi:riboflavin kinase / FMN adenylyltransferase
MIIRLEHGSSVPSQVQGGALTIGNFDGVHRGHHAIIRQIRSLADEVSGPAIVFTFDPPPARLLRPNEAPEALTDIQRRAELLTSLGIDYVVVCKTTVDLLKLEPEEFFHQIVERTLRAKAIAEGENFHFGRQRRGDIQLLKSLCHQCDIRFQVLEPQMHQGEWISSSRIRSLIEQGNIVDANALLLEPYRLTGTVGHGAARGRTLGFPTANLEQLAMLCPPIGVYAGRVAGCLGMQALDDDGAPIPSPVGLPVALNVGPNPTFSEMNLKVEAHVIGYQGDLYGCELSIELVDKLRDVVKFESKEQLLAQLALDIQRAKQIAGTPCGK